jgi:hypothetical protein
MNSNVQAIAALCAGAGFVIVWLVFPSNGSRKSSGAEEATISAESSEDEPEFGSAEEEAPKSQFTNSGSRPRWCDILLLEPDASPSAIRKAYARLMKGLHPDVSGADEHTSRQCAIVHEAYQQAMQDRQARA